VTKRTALLCAALTLALGLPARARLGDPVAQTIFRYGDPVSSTGKPGALTSTRTFEASGLTITCGYVNGVVEMESYTRADRAFIPPEIEAFLRTDGRHQNWTPGANFGYGTYTRADGATADVTQTRILISTKKWVAAKAKDAAAIQAATNKKAASAPSINGADSSVKPGASINTAPSTTTNAANSSATKP
jgi:hypothetical protein